MPPDIAEQFEPSEASNTLLHKLTHLHFSFQKTISINYMDSKLNLMIPVLYDEHHFTPRIRCLMAIEGPSCLESLKLSQKLVLLHTLIWHLSTCAHKLSTHGLMRVAGCRTNGMQIIEHIINNENACQYDAHDYWNAVLRIINTIHIQIDDKSCKALKAMILKHEDERVLGNYFVDLVSSMTEDSIKNGQTTKNTYSIEVVVLLFQLGQFIHQFADKNAMSASNIGKILAAHLIDFFDLIDLNDATKTATRTSASLQEVSLVQPRLTNMIAYIIENELLNIDFRGWVATQLHKKNRATFISDVHSMIETQAKLRHTYLMQTLTKEYDSPIAELTAQLEGGLATYSTYRTSLGVHFNPNRSGDFDACVLQEQASRVQLAIYRDLVATRAAIKKEQEERDAFKNKWRRPDGSKII